MNDKTIVNLQEKSLAEISRRFFVIKKTVAFILHSLEVLVYVF